MRSVRPIVLLWMGFTVSLTSCTDVPADRPTFGHQDAQTQHDRGNYEEAARMWRVLAEEGDTESQFSLGVSYHLGTGVPRDNGEAREWFLKSANQGHPTAMQMLGFLYFAGWGVPQDYVAAHMWYNLSAAHGGSAGPGRDSVAEMMTPSQIAEAQRLAREWIEERSGSP
jgi:uncharacterized protein